MHNKTWKCTSYNVLMNGVSLHTFFQINCIVQNDTLKGNTENIKRIFEDRVVWYVVKGKWQMLNITELLVYIRRP